MTDAEKVLNEPIESLAVLTQRLKKKLGKKTVVTVQGDEVILTAKAFEEELRTVVDACNADYRRIEKLSGDALELVIAIGERANAIVEKYAKIKVPLEEKFEAAGLKFPYATLLNYRDVAKYRANVFASREEFKRLAEADGLECEFTRVDAYDVAKSVKRAEKQAANGGTPRKPRTVPDVKAAANVVIVTSDNPEDIRAVLELCENKGQAFAFYTGQPFNVAKAKPFLDAVRNIKAA